jgi:membrane protease YdiL (CAAX protease family)
MEVRGLGVYNTSRRVVFQRREPVVGGRMTTSRSDSLEPSGLPAHCIIALHLIPGAMFSAFFFALSGVFIRYGLTGYLALLISIPACLMPMLMGIIFLWSRRPGETGSVVRAITYRERGAVGDYVLLPILLYLCWALCSLLLVPLTGLLEARLFNWFPARLSTEALLNGVDASPSGQRGATLILAITLSGLLAPLIEEVYFRGFLLPRMRRLGRMAPVVNSFLFGLYHFFSPWNLPAIFVAFLPVVFVVRAKRNFRIGLVTHAMFNITGVLTVFLHRR